MGLGQGRQDDSPRSPPKVKVTQDHLKVTLNVTPDNHLKVIQGHFKVKLKITRNDMRGYFKVTLVKNVLLLPTLVRRVSNAS